MKSPALQQTLACYWPHTLHRHAGGDLHNTTRPHWIFSKSSVLDISHCHISFHASLPQLQRLPHRHACIVLPHRCISTTHTQCCIPFQNQGGQPRCVRFAPICRLHTLLNSQSEFVCFRSHASYRPVPTWPGHRAGSMRLHGHESNTWENLVEQGHSW